MQITFQSLICAFPIQAGLYRKGWVQKMKIIAMDSSGLVATVAILEEENASTMVGDYVVCYWFKGADSYQEAIEKVAAGKEVLTIKVVFADNKVVDKTFGNFVVE